jgi:hypothetical protein
MSQVKLSVNAAYLTQDTKAPISALVPLTCKPDPQPGDWVHLYVSPSPYAHDMALLLCQIDADRWVTWVPDHGQAEVDRREFCSAY